MQIQWKSKLSPHASTPPRWCIEKNQKCLQAPFYYVPYEKEEFLCDRKLPASHVLWAKDMQYINILPYYASCVYVFEWVCCLEFTLLVYWCCNRIPGPRRTENSTDLANHQYWLNTKFSSQATVFCHACLSAGAFKVLWGMGNVDKTILYSRYNELNWKPRFWCVWC